MKNTACILLLSSLFVTCNRPNRSPGAVSLEKGGTESPQSTLDEIRVRDPFVLPHKRSDTYFLYAQMGNREDARQKGVEVYESRDLQNWTGPSPVFILPDSLWADYQVWAPEVHAYRGKYYLFVTLSSTDTLDMARPYQTERWPTLHRRATQVFVADSPRGPFRAFANRPHTPAEWSSLDGTLYVEEGTPWMVFCHEWTQVVNGTLELVRLEKDLSRAAGDPETLFSAADAPWVRPIRDHGFVTDGPFLYTTQKGTLIMIWSSFGENGYGIGQAISESGKISGPWVQGELLFRENGGHGMIFETFDGTLLLTFHQPNRSPEERARFYRIRERNDRLELVSPYHP